MAQVGRTDAIPPPRTKRNEPISRRRSKSRKRSPEESDDVDLGGMDQSQYSYRGSSGGHNTWDDDDFPHGYDMPNESPHHNYHREYGRLGGENGGYQMANNQRETFAGGHAGFPSRHHGFSPRQSHDASPPMQGDRGQYGRPYPGEHPSQRGYMGQRHDMGFKGSENPGDGVIDEIFTDASHAGGNHMHQGQMSVDSSPYSHVSAEPHVSGYHGDAGTERRNSLDYTESMSSLGDGSAARALPASQDTDGLPNGRPDEARKWKAASTCFRTRKRKEGGRGIDRLYGGGGDGKCSSILSNLSLYLPCMECFRLCLYPPLRSLVSVAFVVLDARITKVYSFFHDLLDPSRGGHVEVCALSVSSRSNLCPLPYAPSLDFVCNLYLQLRDANPVQCEIRMHVLFLGTIQNESSREAGDRGPACQLRRQPPPPHL